MEHPASRVLTVLELLQTHRQMSGAELAQRLQVDRRTVRRYIALLESMGIPVTTERGPAGGYALMPGFKLPPMMFTAEEAQAVALGLAAVRGMSLAQSAPAIEGARAKLERVLPDSLKRRVRAIAESVAFGAQPARSAVAPEVLPVLSAAAHGSRTVRLRYQSHTGDLTERDLDPYGLAFHSGRWYTAGYCHLRKSLRTFRLDRVAEAIALDQAFRRPPDFHIVDHVTLGIATVPRRHRIEVLLEADLAQASAELFPSIGILEAHGPHVLLRATADDLDWFARELARLPFAFHVRQPRALSAALRRLAQSLLARAK